MQYHFDNLREAVYRAAEHLLTSGESVSNKRWQGKDAHEDEFSTYEVTDLTFLAPIEPDLKALQDLVKPNLPWADQHFLERVGGVPLNPGVQYKNWPFYKKDVFREEKGGKFTHTYMERFWPKYAEAPIGRLFEFPNQGIRYPYGDLDDTINLLLRDPLTRQAYFPIFFPEDTGAVHQGRIPCTLGYHFLCRKDKLHIFYPIRSCDLFRHFKDDVYLACRLLLWVLKELQHKDPTWDQITPGDLTMNIYSLHIFYNEVNILRNKLQGGVL